MKNKKISAILSLLFPGLGHLYVGQYLDAIVFMIGTGVLWYAMYAKGLYWFRLGNFRFYLILGALIIVYIFSLIDSYRKTR